MADQPKSGYDPQNPSGGQQQPQQPSQTSTTDPTQQNQGKVSDQEDQELSQYLQDEHGHTKESADSEVKRDREGIRKRKREHEEHHGKKHSSR